MSPGGPRAGAGGPDRPENHTQRGSKVRLEPGAGVVPRPEAPAMLELRWLGYLWVDAQMRGEIDAQTHY